MPPIAEFPKPTVIPPHVWAVSYDQPTPTELHPFCFRTLERAIACLDRHLEGEWEREDGEDEVTLTRDDDVITISKLEVQ